MSRSALESPTCSSSGCRHGIQLPYALEPSNAASWSQSCRLLTMWSPPGLSSQSSRRPKTRRVYGDHVEVEVEVACAQDLEVVVAALRHLSARATSSDRCHRMMMMGSNDRFQCCHSCPIDLGHQAAGYRDAGACSSRECPWRPLVCRHRSYREGRSIPTDVATEARIFEQMLGEYQTQSGHRLQCHRWERPAPRKFGGSPSRHALTLEGATCL